MILRVIMRTNLSELLRMFLDAFHRNMCRVSSCYFKVLHIFVVYEIYFLYEEKLKICTYILVKELKSNRSQ